MFIRKLFYGWKDEYQKDVRYGLKGKKLFEQKSKFQKITIFESKRYGKALLLDYCWMTAEKQEKQYHECLVHPALSSAEELNNVLIIGGGDGGSARECLKYRELKQLKLIEIDKDVIESYIKLRSSEINEFKSKESFDKTKNVTKWDKDNTLDC